MVRQLLESIVSLGVAFAFIAVSAAPDPFIGTRGTGNITPGASVPFGFVLAGPDTSATPMAFTANKGHCGGYQFTDGWLWRFSQVHISGTGCPSFGDFGILPVVGAFDRMGGPVKIVKDGSERAEPGFYAVTIEENGLRIGCEVTALRTVAAYRFTLPKGTRELKLLLDLDWGLSPVGTGDCWGKYVLNSKCAVPDDPQGTVRGGHKMWLWNDYEYHFALRCSAALEGSETLRGPDGLRGGIHVLNFRVADDEPVVLRIGLSSTSSDAAERNLVAEAPNADFDSIRHQASARWRENLSRIELDPGTTETVRRNFEAAQFRAIVHPNDISDVGARPFYTTLSTWDTYRAAQPLYQLLFPERIPGLVDSMLQMCDKMGYLPIWGLGGSENHCMIGHHAVPIIVSAYRKGLLPASAVERAYGAVRQSLRVSHKAANDGTWGLMKEDWDVLDKYGYYPIDKMGGIYGGNRVRGESVARTFECAYDDACAARFAAALGKSEDAEFFARRSQNWKNVFDKTIGYARGRYSDGRWREPFNRHELGLGPWADNDFCEGGSCQYSWHVQQDPEGLVALLGGRRKAGEKLDFLFADKAPSAEDSAITADDPQGRLFKDEKAVEGEKVENYDVSGCIGQYVHGNEPSHHIIYFYRYTDRPERIGERIREVFETQYFPRPDGLCGNDDCGSMSAWYVFSALGFYPFDPCDDSYVLGVPQVPGATIRWPGGRIFRISVRNFSREHVRVKSVALNGKPFHGFKLRHEDIVRGGELVFEME